MEASLLLAPCVSDAATLRLEVLIALPIRKSLRFIILTSNVWIQLILTGLYAHTRHSQTMFYLIRVLKLVNLLDSCGLNNTFFSLLLKSNPLVT